MIDKEIIEKKIDIISENMDYLREVSRTDLDAFVSNFERIQATKHSLQEAIEACLDIANHIIAAEGFPRAEEYGQFFTTRLVEMAKFRNLLVHRYSLVDSKELHKILTRSWRYTGICKGDT